MIPRLLLSILLILVISSCSTTPKSTTEYIRYPSHSNKMILIEERNVPATLKFKRIKDLSETAIKNSSFQKAKLLIADQARDCGADAIINVTTFVTRANLLSRGASGAEGIAVKIEDKNQPEWKNIIGEWY